MCYHAVTLVESHYLHYMDVQVIGVCELETKISKLDVN